MPSDREISQQRAKELHEKGERMRQENKLVPSGLDLADSIEKNQERIRSIMGASENEWCDWHWQIKNRITTASRLNEIIELTDKEKEDIEKVGREFRWGVSPYFASLIDIKNPKDPIRAQSIPRIDELLDVDSPLDPMEEHLTSPVQCITRRYPDRLIINVTNRCPSYCRHCQRRRRIGQRDHHSPKEGIEEGIQYIRDNPEVRDVLITGGDALMLEDDELDGILGELDDIPSVEMKRLGSRAPSTLPYRVTPDLCDMLSKHHPLFINTQFNHPKEITVDAAKACDLLTRAGIPIGNQAVLLAGVNDHPIVQRKLCQALLKVRIRPYYLFHCKSVRGIAHFRTSVDLGIEIIENLRGHTTGLAIPRFIVNTPGGLGKVPIMPDYIVSRGEDYITIRTWEMKTRDYENPRREQTIELENPEKKKK